MLLKIESSIAGINEFWLIDFADATAKIISSKWFNGNLIIERSQSERSLNFVSLIQMGQLIELVACDEKSSFSLIDYCLNKFPQNARPKYEQKKNEF